MAAIQNGQQYDSWSKMSPSTWTRFLSVYKRSFIMCNQQLGVVTF